ncbi:MAG: Stp1/IreP family PP2C-type Ser/Thr phosphatase [Firmicutes bacterium]|nr:Stp1/IreP family PP2C-type Ser/Thr phosphatase [Bacillota bacterium]HOB34398.1 Stp1/IreP family PP2C-type Ser/Thr phosphatase [Bacillota bacterium]HPZ89862.1 Stp1/IreP family PP2C-type Ser/Thr phosphatase [Bacillota bacterium]HQE01122.1 Stp1/IreP family PP2C-type Ser/Thr phosphatase [Bacillota bacterium]
MKAYGVSRRGLLRTNNEDCFYADESRGIFIVADGMGGHAGGEVASRLAVETVKEGLADFHRDPERAVETAIMSANAAVLTKAAAVPALAGMGTTLTMAVVLPGFLVTGHIGDSQAYLIGSEGRCLTSDHSVSGMLLAAGKITAAEARLHPQRHILTRALGIDEHAEVEVLRHSWSPGQRLLLCTDGLTEVVTAREIFSVVREAGAIKNAVDALVDMVYQRGAPDNVTVILAEL